MKWGGFVPPCPRASASATLWLRRGGREHLGSVVGWDFNLKGDFLCHCSGFLQAHLSIRKECDTTGHAGNFRRNRRNGATGWTSEAKALSEVWLPALVSFGDRGGSRQEDRLSE